MRIKKLKEKGFIEPIMGVNINKVGLYMAQVRITTTNTTKILNTFRNCPFFLNGFIISGKDNCVIIDKIYRRNYGLLIIKCKETILRTVVLLRELNNYVIGEKIGIKIIDPKIMRK